MQGATRLRLMLLPFAIAAVFVAVPATTTAQSKPTKYVLVSETKGCLVTLNDNTGKLTFKAEKGHFGRFTVVVRHGKKKVTYRFTVTRPKVKSKPPVVTVIKPPGTTPPIVIIEPTVPVVGPTGPTGPGTPTTPPTPTPSPTPPTASHPPVNLSAPVLRGTPIVGDTITLTYGTWSDSTSQTGTWYDCNAQGTHCSVDTNQPPGDLYVVQPGDIGHSLLLAETATGPGGKTTVDSTQTAIVTNPATAPAPPLRSGVSPYPVVDQNDPPPSNLPALPSFPDPGVACLDSGLGYFSVPIFTIGGPVTPDLCGFWYDFPPISEPGQDPVVHATETQELCADWVTVYNYVSRGVYQQPGDTIGKQEYYFDPQPGPPGSGGETGGLPDTCYAYVGASTGSSTDHWVFVFSDSSIPWPPQAITTLEESISLIEFPYQFPYPTEP